MKAYAQDAECLALEQGIFTQPHGGESGARRTAPSSLTLSVSKTICESPWFDAWCRSVHKMVSLSLNPPARAVGAFSLAVKESYRSAALEIHLAHRSDRTA